MRAMRDLPPLAAVRAFEAAARHLSFTRAAAELGMTQAAVSYQIRLLEERLGVALFLRQPQQVVLTEAGQRLAGPVSDAFAGLRSKLEAYAELRRTLDGGGEAEQAEVDRIFGALSAPSEPALPKGHSPTTAELVRQSLMHADGPLSAQEIAERTGVSRQTAQRYL